jgi:hypothetical protein
MSNYSFFHKSIRLPLVILNLRAFSSKSSYFIFNNYSDSLAISKLKKHLKAWHPVEYNVFLSSAVNVVEGNKNNAALTSSSVIFSKKEEEDRLDDTDDDVAVVVAPPTNSNSKQQNFAPLLRQTKISDMFQPSEEWKYYAIKWTVAANHPLANFEKQSFRDMIRALNPKATSFTAQYVQNCLDAQATACKKIIRHALRNQPVAITLDKWTSRAIDGYLGIVAHRQT